MIRQSTSNARVRRTRYFGFIGGFGLGASCLALGLAGSLASGPARAQSTGIVRGIVCAVPINLCLRVVTHAIVGGAVVVRDRPLIPALGPLSLLGGQPIDVTGDGRDDLAVTLAVPITLLPPGYNANKPTLKVTRLAGAPANLPVKVEVVTDNAGGGKLSFGYDARMASAPQSFTAVIDLTDRDGQPDTSQALVNLSITRGNSTGVALVTETFSAGTGLAESQRLQRDVTQIGYRTVPALGTLVPGSATIDYTDSPGTQHILLTRSEPTTAELLLDAPDHDPRISGRIDRLPTNVELTIVSEDFDDDDSTDRLSIDYAGSQPVHEAQLKFETLTEDPAGDHRPVLGFTVHDLPQVLHLEYDLANSALALDSSARIAGVDVSGDDSVPFFERASHFRIELDDLPRALDASFGGGHVTLDAYADAGRQARDALAALFFRGQDLVSDSVPVPDCGAPLCDDGYDAIRDASRNGAVRDDVPGRPYLLAARLHKLKQADIVTSPNTDILVDTAPDLGPPGSACGEFPPPGCTAATESYRAFEALLLSEREDEDPLTPPVTTLRARLASLLPGTRFTQGTLDGGTPDDKLDDIDYIGYGNATTNNSLTDVLVDGSNIAGPVGTNGQAADTLRVELQGVPNDLRFSYAAGGFPLKLRSAAQGAGTRLTDVRLTSANATAADLLPAWEAVDYEFTPGNSSDDEPRNLDGVRIRDFDDRYSIHARLAWLRDFTVDKQSKGGTDTPCLSGDELCVRLATGSTGQHPRLRFDSETATEYAFSDGNSLPGVSTVFATLDQIPSTLLLRQFKGPDEETRLVYQGATTVGTLGESSRKGFELSQTTRYHNPIPDGVRPDSDMQLSLGPMPMSFDLCSSGDNAVCSQGIFNRTDADSGSLRLQAVPRTRFRYSEQPNVQAQVFTIADITADLFRFQADADGAGYLAYDTGWNSAASSTPPEAARLGSSLIKQVKGTRDITEFAFGDRFAADKRKIAWSSQEVLFLADTTDITSLLTRTGAVQCTSGTNLVLHRVGPGGIDLELNLTNELCE